ncbi:MAG: B12-binding domain-containing radical SAM protein [Bacteroidales bacterium]
MNILLVYPEYPDTFWGFKQALKFISKKAAVPPLGLITVSAMLPESWNKRLIDLNVTKLMPGDIQWADYIFLSAMYVQKESVNKIIKVCKQYHKKIVAGGPLFTQESQNYPEIDHFVLNEAEITLQPFLNALQSDGVADKKYFSDKFADIKTSPVPDYHLLPIRDYASMNMQISRGCPNDCDFCEITSLFGHKMRMKTTEQVIKELDCLYNLHWRGTISIVDDNFIGNKKEIKYNLLPAMYEWMRQHKNPFTFSTQTTINLADDDELLSLMVKTGYTSTFIGIETPDEASLTGCNKLQNRNRDLLGCVRKIQNSGMQVSAGFIVGFDTDTSGVFKEQISFIQKSGIVSAMVGLLNAPKHTTLYKRLEAENRLLQESTGSNTDYSMNFIPKMDYGELLQGYTKVIQGIYSEKPYYKRVRQFLTDYRKSFSRQNRISFNYLKAFAKSVIIIGIIKKGRYEYWKLLIWTLFHHPKLLPDAITFSVYGLHFRSTYQLG